MTFKQKRYLIYTAIFWAILYLPSSLSMGLKWFYLALMNILLYIGISYLVIRRFVKPAPENKNLIDKLTLQLKTIDKQRTNLEIYSTEQNWPAFKSLATKTLIDLDNLKRDLELGKDDLAIRYYKRLTASIELDYKTISQRLQQLSSPQSNYKKDRVENLAPELSSLVKSVKNNQNTIINFLKNSRHPQKEELLQLLQNSMDNFEIILDGYLNIKKAPDNFLRANERLEKAKEILTQFDNSLKTQIRQLNEENLHDFEVSLRLLNTTKQGDTYESI